MPFANCGCEYEWDAKSLAFGLLNDIDRRPSLSVVQIAQRLSVNQIPFSPCDDISYSDLTIRTLSSNIVPLSSYTADRVRSPADRDHPLKAA